MSTRKRVMCSECRIKMNIHAEKIDRSSHILVEETDLFLEGPVIEILLCPACGQTETRRVTGRVDNR